MPNEDHNVCVVATCTSRRDEAAAFATAYDIPLCSDDASTLQLRFDEQGIGLYDDELGARIGIDFLAGAIAHRERFGGGKGQAIAKAIGLNRHTQPTVMDVTAGLARDAWVLASLGCRMTLLERSAVLFAMIEDAVFKAREEDATGSVANIIATVRVDSIEHLRSLTADACPDVIYMDPMYPGRSKSALVKKDMQILHKLIGATPDETALLEISRQRARKRVVVKRPAGAPRVGDQQPSHEISSKKTRYDVYMCGNGD